MLEFWSRSEMTETFPVQIILQWRWDNEKKQIVLHGLAVLSGCGKLGNVKTCWPKPEVSEISLTNWIQGPGCQAL